MTLPALLGAGLLGNFAKHFSRYITRVSNSDFPLNYPSSKLRTALARVLIVINLDQQYAEEIMVGFMAV
jgi:hypothetical protein